MSGKNIVIITRELVPFYYGGIGTQFKALAQLLREDGHRITLLSMRPDNFDEAVFKEYYPGITLHFVDCRRLYLSPDFSPTGGLISTFHYTYSLSVLQAFDALTAAFAVDCVVCAEFGAEGFFLLKKKKAGFYQATRFVLFIEGSLFDTLTTYEGGEKRKYQSELIDPQNRLNCAMEDACVHMADELIVPTGMTWRQTKKRLKLERQVNIIANIPDDRLFDPCCKRIPRETDRRTALFVGRLDRHKGADILLSAYVQMYENRTTEAPRLIFIGRDTFNKQYQMTFLEWWQERIPAPLKSKIVFLGQVPHSDVVKYFREATVAVFPSRWEVFGIVCLEAMSYGCPVIVSRGTGLEEVIGSDLQDYAVDFQTQQEKLRELFKLFFHDPEWDASPLRKQIQDRAFFLIENARDRFKEFFRQELIAGNKEYSVNSEQLALLLDDISLALTDILITLGNDFSKLSDWSALSQQEMTQVLTTGKKRTKQKSRNSPAVIGTVRKKIKQYLMEIPGNIQKL